MEQIPLAWRTVTRKVNDLVPLDINPRKISEAKRMKMIESLQAFNLVTLPEIDHDNTILSGHQRLRALQAVGRGEEMIEARMPNRPLSKSELKKWNLLANSHFGEFDLDMLDEQFADIDFSSIGFELPDMSDLGDPDKSGTPDNSKYAPPDNAFGDEGIQPKNRFGVIVMCEDEGHQQTVFNNLQGSGLSCKIVVV